MAVPKKRQSRSRQGKRRASWKTSLPAINKCGNCAAPTVPHQACTECGFYRGRPVIKVSAEGGSASGGKAKEAKSQKEKK